MSACWCQLHSFCKAESPDSSNPQNYIICIIILYTVPVSDHLKDLSPVYLQLRLLTAPPQPPPLSETTDPKFPSVAWSAAPRELSHDCVTVCFPRSTNELSQMWAIAECSCWSWWGHKVGLWKLHCFSVFVRSLRKEGRKQKNMLVFVVCLFFDTSMVQKERLHYSQWIYRFCFLFCRFADLNLVQNIK